MVCVWLKRADNRDPSANRTWIIVVGSAGLTANWSSALNKIQNMNDNEIF